MSAVLLDSLEGYQPLATTGSLDRYIFEHGFVRTSAVASLGNLATSPAELHASALHERLEIQQQQGIAPYVAGLTATLLGTRKDFVDRQQLERTALTDTFKDRYGVAIGELTSGQSNSFRIFAQPYSEPEGVGMTLAYQIVEGGRGTTFWKLGIDATYGYANMYCHTTNKALPLSGEGNIAFIPGVQEALKADVRLVTEAAFTC